MRAMRALYHNNKNVPVKTSIKTFDLSVLKCGTAQKIKSYRNPKKMMNKIELYEKRYYVLRRGRLFTELNQ